MKEINLYITEKFKISKDIKSNYDSDKITELIAKIFLVEKNQKVIKYINDWVIDNDIQLIEVFYQKSDPKTKDIVKVRDENYISSNRLSTICFKRNIILNTIIPVIFNSHSTPP